MTQGKAEFRMRQCNRCGALFCICVSCDRGQRYCSDECRSQARREQVRAAKRRHQQSKEGKEDHRDRQRDYRERERKRRERERKRRERERKRRERERRRRQRKRRERQRDNRHRQRRRGRRRRSRHNRRRTHRGRGRRQRVTYQSSQSVLSPPLSTRGEVIATPTVPLIPTGEPLPASGNPRCVVCGRTADFVDPFPLISTRR
jgi:hypothetical protein